MGFAFLASSISALGACSVWGCSVSITFAAWETVDDDEGVTLAIRCAPLVFVSVAVEGDALAGT
jgi:hypothetical protein